MYFIEENSNAEAAKNLTINLKTFKYSGNSCGQLFFQRHNHIILEILAVKSGSMRLITEKGNYILRAREVAVINPFCQHFGEGCDQGCEYVCLTVNLKIWLSVCGNDALKEALEVLDEKLCFKEYYQNPNELFNILLKLEKLFSLKDTSSQCAFSANVYSLFALLFKDCVPVTDSFSSSRSADFMREIEIYLKKNYKENISTSHIAKEFFMTVPCFCYNFKHNFGTSFLKYLSKYRITAAINLYPGWNGTLSDLAEEVGFLDYNYFCRCFKKQTGVSPAKYFGKRKE